MIVSEVTKGFDGRNGLATFNRLDAIYIGSRKYHIIDDGTRCGIGCCTT
jgi:hypothetical protein